MIRLQCRKCRARHEVPDDMDGWLVPCRVCRTENVAKWPNSEPVTFKRRKKRRPPVRARRIGTFDAMAIVLLVSLSLAALLIVYVALTSSGWKLPISPPPSWPRSW
jgi:hypothetical protein